MAGTLIWRTLCAFSVPREAHGDLVEDSGGLGNLFCHVLKEDKKDLVFGKDQGTDTHSLSE